MSDVHIHIHFSPHPDTREGCAHTMQFAHIIQKLDTIMSTQAELATQLTDLKNQNDKATAEQQVALANLQAALEAAGNTTPEVDAALATLKSSIQRDDDLNPDATPA